MKRKSDAVIGHTSLREIVCSYTLAAVSRAYLTLTFGGDAALLLLTAHIVQTGAQYLHSLVAVLKLTALVLTFNYDTGRNMQQTYRRLGLVDMLSARAAALYRFYFKVGGIKLDLYLFSLRQHRNCILPEDSVSGTR